jgi:hypothetical protein
LGTGYKARILLGNEEVYATRDDATLDPRRLPGSEYIVIADSPAAGQIRALLPVPSCDSRVGHALYAFGQRDLTIEVTTNATGSGPLLATATLTVVPEMIDTWWTWPEQPDAIQGLAIPMFAWKQRYNILGTFTNKSLYVPMHLDAVLQEQEEISGPIRARSYPSSDVDWESSITVSLPLPNPIFHDWKWFEQALSYPDAGPTSKTFYYTADLALRDCYGNPYAITSAALPVLVRVSADKLNLGAAAWAAQLSSWVLGALAKVPVIGWIFGAGGAVAQATALGLGARALDPAEADSRFLKSVRVGRNKLPEAMRTEARLRPLGEMFARVDSIANAMVALEAIESRLIGARLAGSRDGQVLQVTSYRDVVNEMVHSVTDLPQLTEDAIASLESFDELQPSSVHALALGERQPYSLLEQIEGSALSKVMLNDAVAAVNDGPTSDLLAGGIGPILRLISDSVSNAVAIKDRDADRVFALPHTIVESPIARRGELQS